MDINIYSILSFILVFFTIVFFHELGHYSVARFFDVRINEFFLGFGPVLFKKQKGETLYSLRLFPLGGAVVMEGEDEDSADERAFFKKEAWQKFLIVLAGPVMNFVIAIVILFFVFASTGFLGNKVSKVMENSAAYEAGIQIGDEIIRIDETPVDDWNTIIEKISTSEGRALEFEVIRDSKKQIIHLTPKYNETDKRYLVGISAIEKNPAKAFQMAIVTTKDMIVETFRILSRIFTDPEVQKGISGPVGIYSAIDHFSKQGFISLMTITAIISVNLGIMNILPLPALDGGRMVILLFEMITRRKVNSNFENNLHKIGFIFLLGLMVLVLIKDIVAPVALPV